VYVCVTRVSVGNANAITTTTHTKMPVEVAG